MPIQLKTLGQIDLRARDGAPLAGLLAQPKRLALLVYLAAGGSRFVRRDTLLAMFWPESDDERARASLRKALHFIRGEAGDLIVSRGSDEIGIRPDAVWLDASAMEALAAQGSHGEALSLYRGDFLPGFMVRGAPDFERWSSEERTRYRRRAAASAWTASEMRAAADDATGARALADRAVALSPDDESAVRRYLHLLADSGDRLGALVFYQEFAARLAAEHDVVPTAETRGIVAELSTRHDDASHPSPSNAPVSPGLPSDLPHRIVAMTDAARDSSLATSPLPVATVGHETELAEPPVGASSSLAKRTRWAAALIVASVGMLVSAYLARARAEPPSTISRVAVFPFLVRGTADLKYLADGLPILLSTRLDGAGRIRAVDPRALLLAVPQSDSNGVDPARALRVAEQLGSQLYVLGTVLGSPDALHLVVALYDRTRGEGPVARTEATGREADLAGLVDRLATKLLADHLRGEGDVLSETAARTTSSLVALKAWLAGEAALRAGQHGPALDFFDEAIRADSGFALAHFRHAVAANWAGRMGLVLPSLERAVAHQDRLTPYTRTVVHAFQRFRTARYAEAESLYRVVVADHPAAIESWYELGEVLYHTNPQRGRAIAEARPAFERVIALDPRNFAAQVHLARLAASRADWSALDSLSRSALRNDPDGSHRVELLLLRALALNDDSARVTVSRLLPDAAVIDALWRASEYTGSLAAAHKICAAMLVRTESDEMRASLRILLAHLAMGTGQFQIAEREVDSLGVYAPHAAALTSVLLATHPMLPATKRAHRIAYARAALGVLRAPSGRARLYIGSNVVDDFASLAPLYEGLLNLADGDTTAARRLFAAGPPGDGRDELARSELDLALASDARAGGDALRRLAARDVRLRTQHSASLPWHPRAIQHLTAARLLAQQGRTAEARARLAAVPEDLGFNVAYLAAVSAARAALVPR